MNHYYSRRHNGTNNISRLEDKMDTMFNFMRSINLRLATIERQQRKDFAEESINRLKFAADKMKAQCKRERQIIREMYGHS